MELAKFIDEKLSKYDHPSSIDYTGNIYGYLRSFERVNRSEHGRAAYELNIIRE